MEKSNSITELAKATAKFKKELPKIGLDASVKVQTKTGGSYSFQYASLPHIKDIADPVLSDNGLFVSQLIEEGGRMTTILMHESGEFIQSTMTVGKTEGISAQEYGSLITYARRYAYCALLGIIADEDDDANEAVGNKAEKVEKTKAVQKESNPDGMKAPNNDTRTWLNAGTKEWTEAIKYLQSEEGSLLKIEKKYRLSQANKEKLIEQAQEVLANV